VSVLASAAQDPQPPPIRFVNAAVESGISFTHQNGATPEKFMPETMSGGGLFFDYDDDGWLDVFLVNGGSFVDPLIQAAATHGLYHNNGDGTFVDVSAGSGIGLSGYGMGACSADYDNDGDADLYVTAAGPNAFYRNAGQNGFEDVTGETGTGVDLWSVSCAFADVDNDGDVDLYVANYVDFAVDNNKPCVHNGNTLVYCHPNVYNGVSDTLFRNNGDGTFSDVSRESGIYTTAGKGLGVVFADYDRDGWIDIYVANDSVPNFLFHNIGEGLFEEVALFSGVAMSRSGEPLAGMGTDMADVDGDGLADIFVTNLNTQTHNLYTNTGDGIFLDSTFESGAARATLPFVGFGAAFLDFDNDSDLDIAIANGDVIDNMDQFRDDVSYPQRNLLLENNGAGGLTDVGPEAGPGFELEKVSRALAHGDIDNDGDLDILIVNVGQTTDLLRNDSPGNGTSIMVRLIGRTGNRDAIGAELTLAWGGQSQVRHVKAGSSYLAQNDLRVHFGLGDAERAESLEIRWPGGDVERIEGVESGHIYTVGEGEGIIDSVPFSLPR
jgi:hypothetical protein